MSSMPLAVVGCARQMMALGLLPGSTLDLPIRSAITAVLRGAPPTLPNNAARPGTRKSTYGQSALHANTSGSVSCAISTRCDVFREAVVHV